MKTSLKEIEVWVQEEWHRKSYPVFCVAFDNSAECTVKARLIIEIPEKTVTITESEFDEAFGFFKPSRDFLMTQEGFESGKEKLFGDKK